MEQRLNNMIQIIEEGIRETIFPGAVIHVSHKKKPIFIEAFGNAELIPKPRKMEQNLLFDLASLTKVTATLPAILRSVQIGKLDFSTPVASIFPQWNQASDASQRKGVTVGHLLTHSSGLPAWRPLYLKAKSREEYLEIICQEPLEYPIQKQVIYSDLGFMMLGFILEEVWQKPLQDLCKELVFQPLGLEETSYVPISSNDRFVSTEIGNKCEHQMSIDFAEQCRAMKIQESGYQITLSDVEKLQWRTGTTCGEVNDGNAYYGLSGISGHAGLFSTVHDVARYFSIWENEGEQNGIRILDRALVRQAVTNQTANLNLGRGYGFEVSPDKNSTQWTAGCSAGPAAGPNAFGHTGFTGTSMWHDPRSEMSVIILSNRIHPQVKPGILEWRKKLHSAAFAN